MFVCADQCNQATIGDNQLWWQGEMVAADDDDARGSGVSLSISHSDMIANYGAIRVCCYLFSSLSSLQPVTQ